MQCYKCQKDIPDNSLVCKWCGAEMSQIARMRGNNPMSGGFTPNVMTSVGTPMNWYKALVKILLYFSAVQHILNGIVYITGYMTTLLNSLPENAAVTMPYFGGEYRIIDIIYGSLLLLLAAFTIITRFRLAGFKTNAPVMLLIYVVLYTLIPLAYTTAFMIMYGGNAEYISSYIFSEILTCTVVFYANYVYFIKKRKHLFNNQKEKTSAEGKN